MDKQGNRDRARGQRWFQDWRWVASVAAVLFAFAFTTFAITTIRTEVEVADQTGLLEEVKSLSSQTAEELIAIQDNQEGIEELLQFVRDVQADNSEGVVTREEILIFFDLLCASTDPIRNKACDELGKEVVP